MKKLFLLLTFLILVISACSSGNENAEKNVAIVDGYVNAVQQLDYKLMDNFLSDDYVGYGPSANDSINKENAANQWKSNVDLVYEKIEYLRSRSLAVTVPDGPNKGEWVANWAQLQITFKGGEDKVTIWANTVYKIEEDKISKSFTFYNEADALEQLGYIFINPDYL